MVEKQSKIYCVGDSHVSVFLGVDALAPIWPETRPSFLPFFEVFRLGPITAYNISEYNTTTNGREKLEKILERIPQNSWILMSAGEIDCRVHLIKQSQLQNLSFKEVANTLAKRYVGFISNITKNKFKICLLLPPPTSFGTNHDSEYPRFGSELERNKITKVLIQELILECDKLSIPTVNIFESATIPNLKTKHIYLWDTIHLSTYALPQLINQLKAITPYELNIPLIWKAREILRKIKHTFNIVT